jgi:hypothetical protein
VKEREWRVVAEPVWVMEAIEKKREGMGKQKL